MRCTKARWATRPFMYESWLATTPVISASDGLNRSPMRSAGSPTKWCSSSSSGSSTFSRVWVVRKPSWQTRKGVSLSSAARRAMAVRSAASCALRAKRIPQPQSATPITSSCPAWMLSAWLVRARAPTWKTAGSRLPAMTYRTSFIRISPCPAVKFVTRPPASANPSAADADECSDSGSRKRSGVPHRLVLPSATAAWKSAAMVVEGVIG